jgi:hypothetical protein
MRALFSKKHPPGYFIAEESLGPAIKSSAQEKKITEIIFRFEIMTLGGLGVMNK